jgi:RNA polymerase-binding transcription factor DksA
MSTTATGAPGVGPDQRVELRRKLEELAALEANRVERGEATETELLDAYDIGLGRHLDDALAKMVDGTYGICETCEGPIPVDRLKAVPYARRCLTCQEREENGWHPVQ